MVFINLSSNCSNPSGLFRRSEVRFWRAFSDREAIFFSFYPVDHHVKNPLHLHKTAKSSRTRLFGERTLKGNLGRNRLGGKPVSQDRDFKFALRGQIGCANRKIWNSRINEPIETAYNEGRRLD